MSLRVLLLCLAGLFIISCGKDKAPETGRSSSFEELLSKLSTNLDTFEPQKVGYQTTMQERATVVYGNSDGTSVSCNTLETTTETILEVREDAVVLFREKIVKNDQGNPQDCGVVASPNSKLLVLVNRESKESIMDEFRKTIDSGDISLQGVRDLGNNRYILMATTVVANGVSVEAAITIDFSVPYFMMNLESSGRAVGYDNQTNTRRVGYNLSVDTRRFNRRGMPTIDERE